MEKIKMFLFFVLIFNIIMMVMSGWFIYEELLKSKTEHLTVAAESVVKKEKINVIQQLPIEETKTVIAMEKPIGEPIKNKENKKKIIDADSDIILKHKQNEIAENKKNNKDTIAYKELVLNDFDEKSLLNTGIFTGTRGTCKQSFYDEVLLEGYSLKLDYDVSDEGAYAGFWNLLGGIDLKSYGYLLVKVKRLQGNGSFKIELSNGIESARVSVKQFLYKKNNLAWENIFIPLSYFKDIKKWKEMKGNLTIIFDYVEGPPYKGTVCIDKIVFVTSKK